MTHIIIGARVEESEIINAKKILGVKTDTELLRLLISEASRRGLPKKAKKKSAIKQPAIKKSVNKQPALEQFEEDDIDKIISELRIWAFKQKEMGIDVDKDMLIDRIMERCSAEIIPRSKEIIEAVLDWLP